MDARMDVYALRDRPQAALGDAGVRRRERRRVKSIARVRACPFLLHADNLRGFVFDVSDARLREVT